MSNFVKAPVKKNVTIKVDVVTWEEARQQKINISKVCRYALRLAIQGKLIDDNDSGRTKG